MARIELQGVTKIFGRDPRRALEHVRAGMGKEQLLAGTGHTLALDDVSLSVAAGEVFVVMGLSGSGKSTLIRHLNRLIDPTAGTITIDGVDILGLPIRELVRFRRDRLAMVFQHFALLPHRSVLDNVAYGLELQGMRASARRVRAREWIEAVGLTGFEDQYPAQLSGGMQQRVGLARALCVDHEILLMDEPFSALDPLIRGQMQDLLMRLQAQLKKIIVFITHDLDEALRLGDRIAILRDGRVVQVGTPAEILLRPADDYVRAFVKDVNRSRVLTVETVMQPPPLRLTDETLEQALAEMQRSGTAVGYVVSGGDYRGVVTEEAVRDAIARSDAPAPVAGIAVTVDTVTPDSPIADALPATLVSEVPVPVVNAAGALEGVLSQRRVGEMLVPPEEKAEAAERQPPR